MIRKFKQKMQEDIKRFIDLECCSIACFSHSVNNKAGLLSHVERERMRQELRQFFFEELIIKGEGCLNAK